MQEAQRYKSANAGKFAKEPYVSTAVGEGQGYGGNNKINYKICFPLTLVAGETWNDRRTECALFSDTGDINNATILAVALQGPPSSREYIFISGIAVDFIFQEVRPG